MRSFSLKCDWKSSYIFCLMLESSQFHRPMTKRRLKETVCWLLFAACEMKCLPRFDEFTNILGPMFREEGRLQYRVTDIGQITIQGGFPKSPSRPPSAGLHPVPDVRCGQRDTIELSECRQPRGASPEQLYFSIMTRYAPLPRPPFTVTTFSGSCFTSTTMPKKGAIISSQV